MQDNDFKTNNTEIDIENIMEHIRDKVRQRHRQTGCSDLENNNTIDNKAVPSMPPTLDTSHILSAINTAEARADIGAEVTPMHHFRGLTRRAALLAGKVIVYLSSFITDKQRSFNSSVIQSLRQITSFLDGLQNALLENSSKKEEINDLRKKIETLGTEQTKAQSAFDGIIRLEKNLKDCSVQITTLQKRLGYLLHDTEIQKESLQQQGVRLDSLSADIKEILSALEEEKGSLSDSLYLSFEDVFRGTREEIRERVQVFLPFIEDVSAGSEENPVLDLGCGRGEWLELLKEQGKVGIGVDINGDMIAQCKARGLNVTKGDCIQFLNKQEPESKGAVTGFHLIEHLPLKTLIRLLEETVRVLKPGGIAILETPNPENIIVSSSYFYLDPTHKNPLPSALMKFLAEASGLKDIKIRYLHPQPEEKRLTGSETAALMNEYFYGPRDYAIIGYKNKK